MWVFVDTGLLKQPYLKFWRDSEYVNGIILNLNWCFLIDIMGCIDSLIWRSKVISINFWPPITKIYIFEIFSIFFCALLRAFSPCVPILVVGQWWVCEMWILNWMVSHPKSWHFHDTFWYETQVLAMPLITLRKNACQDHSDHSQIP